MESRKKNGIIAGIIFGVLMGIYDTFMYGPGWSALFQGVFCGFFFGFFMYRFSKSKKIERQTQVEIAEDDVLIYSGDANHYMNLEGVGGKLYLFSNRLQFQSHKFNIQSHGLTIEISHIAKVAACNTLGLIPNGLSINTIEGKIEKFVVNNRKVWITEIEKLLTNK